jgi:hypothetical protein
MDRYSGQIFDRELGSIAMRGMLATVILHRPSGRSGHWRSAAVASLVGFELPSTGAGGYCFRCRWGFGVVTLPRDAP